VSFRARLLLVVSFAVVAAVCARLGFWQLSRLHERRAANVAALAARAAPEVSLDAVAAMNPTLEGRAVRAVGHYDHTHDVVLRGRAYNGSPGVEVVSPLVLEAGRTAILVNRGFLPAPDAVTIRTDSVREFGAVQVVGTAMSMPSGRGEPLDRRNQTTWARLDRDALRTRMPYELAPVYIRQWPDSALPRSPHRLEPVPIDEGPHRNYAIQWFAFAAMAVVFGGVILRDSNR
jgi:surfeit locus 1 family protein